MLLDNRRRLIVVLPARCGSTTVKQVLLAAFPGCVSLSPNHGLARPFHKAWRGDRYTRVCLVRSPLSRVVSLWSHWRRRDHRPRYAGLDQTVNERITRAGLSFADTIASPTTRSLLFRVCQPVTELTKGLRIDHFVRQEHLEEDLRAALPLDGRDIPSTHKSPEDPPWWSHYDDDSLAWVRREYHGDFERHGYPTTLPTGPT